MLPILVLRPSNKRCYGVYTTKSWKKGDRIHQYEGEIVPTYMTTKGSCSMTIDKNFSLEWKSGGAQCYFNHDCEPNCYIEWVKGMPCLTANRNILCNEEVCYNYNTVELQLLKESFFCHCHAQCGWVRGFMYLTPNEELKILDILSPYIKQMRDEYEKSRD